ncbi:hypothetical protein G7Y89_g11930 [Cudoniella acicularis]|uniref:Uncharacterized protein n=1 Tax=Cudoniella acicularis TaxID=354080 RepID=A0A8H4RCJ2_9HELO|nr:hypothetical protein G7Y89_g11930 [Cudoniella acicularis]
MNADEERTQRRYDTSLDDANVEQAGLLEDHEETLYPKPNNGCFTKYIILLFITNVLLLLGLILATQAPCKDPTQAIYSPAQSEIEYETVMFSGSFGDDLTEYQGWPNDYNDQLWRDTYSALHISDEENSKLYNTTERVTIEGMEDQFLIGMDVFHQLHCLNVLRKSFYPERYNMSMYWPNGTLHHFNWVHYDHCIDLIRQSIMCHADISTLWFKWDEEHHRMKPQLNMMHTCRKFEKLRDWAFERSVTEFDEKKHIENGRVVTYPRPV